MNSVTVLRKMAKEMINISQNQNKFPRHYVNDILSYNKKTKRVLLHISQRQISGVFFVSYCFI